MALAMKLVEPASRPMLLDAPTCRADEALFRAVKTTRIGSAIRVDYQVVETGDARWANMDAALLRKFRIRVGAKFCMPLDSGGVADSTEDVD